MSGKDSGPHQGFQGVYKFMLVSTLAIISTIIGGAIAPVPYLAP